MNGLTIQPNGQTLRVTSGPANFYSDTGLSSAVTYPVTVTTDTPWYCSAAVAVAVPDVSLTITQTDGSTVYSGTIRVGQTSDTFVRPAPGPYQLAADTGAGVIAGSTHLQPPSMENIPASFAYTNNYAMTSGTMRGAGFVAPQSFTVTTLRCASGAVAAAATPSLIRLGLYTVDPSTGDAALVASTPNDTTMFAATTTVYAKGLSTPYAVTGGSLYAIALLIVSGTTMPQVVAAGAVAATAVLGQNPKLGWSLAGQSDLPSAVTFANQSPGTPVYYQAV